MHEFVHYGANTNGIGEYPQEFGDEFEKQAFKAFITKDNAGKYYYDFMQN
ncbi:hypothetical protein GCM10028803_21020 [Larkinella knui]